MQMSGSGKQPKDITDDLPIGVEYDIIVKKAEEEWEREKARRLAKQLDAEEEKKKAAMVPLTLEELAKREAKKKAM